MSGEAFKCFRKLFITSNRKDLKDYDEGDKIFRYKCTCKPDKLNGSDKLLDIIKMISN